MTMSLNFLLPKQFQNHNSNLHPNGTNNRNNGHSERGISGPPPSPIHRPVSSYGFDHPQSPGSHASVSTSSQAQGQTSEKGRQSSFAEFGLKRRRSTGGGAANAASGATSGSGSNTVIGKTRTGKEKDAGGREKSRMSTSIPGGFGPVRCLLPLPLSHCPSVRWMLTR